MPPSRRAYPAPVRKRRLAYVAAALVVAAGAFVAVVLLGGAGHTHGGSGPGGGSSSDGRAVTLRGLTTYDPQGDGGEHMSSAPFATDGDPSTSWYTETYDSPQFGGLKDGLGLVLSAGSSVKLSTLTVQTPTPGFVAQIEVGDSSTGGFVADSSSQTVSSSTTFTLQGKSGRYYVVWITQLPPGNKAEISEVTARS
jgi:hypothetical protein